MISKHCGKYTIVKMYSLALYTGYWHTERGQSVTLVLSECACVKVIRPRHVTRFKLVSRFAAKAAVRLPRECTKDRIAYTRTASLELRCHPYMSI